MGNSSLRELAEITQIELDSLAGKTVAIDAHNWLYTYITAIVRHNNESDYTTRDGLKLPNLIAIPRGIPTIFRHDITPIFVFDGNPNQLKKEEIKRREEQKRSSEEKMKSASGEKRSRHEASAVRLTDNILSTTKQMLELLDIPVVNAPTEGEAQCSYMARHDPDVDYAMTDDYDALTYGSPLTLRNITGRGKPERVDLIATLRNTGLTYEQLVDVAILCGTDFNNGVDGYGPVRSVKAITKYGDAQTFIQEEDESVDRLEDVQNLFLDPPVVEQTQYRTPDSLSPAVGELRQFIVGKYGIKKEAVDSSIERITQATDSQDSGQSQSLIGDW